MKAGSDSYAESGVGVEAVVEGMFHGSEVSLGEKKTTCT